jgi:hypothetical protein
MSKCACHNPCRKSSVYPFTHTLNVSSGPELEYKRTPTNVRHAGQLKLLCSEIAFLNQFRGLQHTVVYAGAAPGTHIPRLARMFPEMHFILIDPQPSAAKSCCEVIEAFMTDKLARELSERLGADVLFMSDVRIGPAMARESDHEQQLRIQRDMTSQMGWHKILDPVASILKFRLPWDLETSTSYLDGEIQLPVFGRHLTHESRLVVKRGAALVLYDNAKYERQMAFFNQVQRVAVYDGDKCYDCTAFRRIIGAYLERPPHDLSVDALCESIERELDERSRQWRCKLRQIDF